MKKPTSVKIVEALGWMEVVLVLYGVIWAVNAIVHGKCGSASDVWICMGISLVVLALPVGMVMSFCLVPGRCAGPVPLGLLYQIPACKKTHVFA